MRTSLLLASLMVTLVACGGRDETASVDSGAAATPAAVPAAGGATLSESSLAGTWNGRAMGIDSDSVIARFTQTCGNGRCRGMVEGGTDSTAATTYRIEGDSVGGTSAPYRHPDFQGDVIDRVVLRMVGDSLVGMGTVQAANSDSVLARMRIVATRAAR